MYFLQNKNSEMINDETLDFNYFEDKEVPAEFNINGYNLELNWCMEDHYFIHAKLIQPDGVIWYGFSSWMSGPGFEETGNSEDGLKIFKWYWKDFNGRIY